jgi:hypothetical protein
VMTSATKLGALIAEAVADAAERVMTGKWPVEGGVTAAASAGFRKTASKAKKTAAKVKRTVAKKAPATKKTATKPKARSAAKKRRTTRKTSA